MSDKYDDMLFEILQENKNLIYFFDTIFGFLKRRTDFYTIAKTPQDVIGLPVGLAEKIVYDALKKHKPNDNTKENGDINVECNFSIDDVPMIEKEEVCETVEQLPSPSRPASAKSNLDKIRQKPDNYNGATYDNYSWSQSITDIDMQVQLPKNFNSKNLIVDIQSSKLSVKSKTAFDPIVEGNFHRKVKTVDSLWSIDKNVLQIHFEKQIESWWERLLEQEPLLDLQQMDCSRPIEELPEDAQAKIEQLRWDAEQKNRGLPTSQDIQNQNLLRKAWNAEGSPFKGSPFDPNVVSFNK